MHTAPTATTAAPAYRLTVTQDTDADSPLDWGTLVVIPWRRALGGHLDRTPRAGTDVLDLMHAAERFTGYGSGGGRGLRGRDGYLAPRGDQIAAAVIRWAAVFHGVAVARWQPTGGSQSDWGDGLVYLAEDDQRALPLADQADALASELATATAWYRGDVFTVALERRVDWARTDGGAGNLSTWETVDAVSGCYLQPYPVPGETRYTSADAAREHFDLPAGLTAADLDTLPVVTA